MTSSAADPLEALLEAAEKFASAQNDEVIFRLLDRIENPTGPLWDLIRELRITCEFRYVERRLRRKQNYIQNWIDNRDYEDYDPKFDSCPSPFDADIHPRTLVSMGRDPTESYGPWFVRHKVAEYKQRLVTLLPCDKCRICVRENLFPPTGSSIPRPYASIDTISTSRSRRLRDRQLAKALVAEKNRNVAGLFVDILR